MQYASDREQATDALHKGLICLYQQACAGRQSITEHMRETASGGAKGGEATVLPCDGERRNVCPLFAMCQIVQPTAFILVPRQL